MKKKIIVFIALIGMIFSLIPVYANESQKGIELATKKSYPLEESNGKYRVELKVPGQDGNNKHDEVILMVDGSYSMDEEWPQMKETIIEIGKSILNGNGNTQLTLMAFGMGDNEVLTHVKDINKLEESLGELPGTLLYGRSSTNCEAGLTGVMEYILSHDESLNEAHVVFISDGRINTDETPHNFYNWRENSWLRYSAKDIITWNLENEIYHIINGGTPSKAFTTVFGEVENVEGLLEIATEEQKTSWVDLAWKYVYEEANLDPNTKYPVSDVERAFVSYDKKNGTYLQDLFYYALIGRKYPNSVTRTTLAGNELAELEKVKSLYMVDYDSYSSWMDTGITSSKSKFIKSNGIAGLVDALSNVLVDLSKTPYNNVVVTDYMSKWVNLDLDSIKIIDDTTNTVIYSIKEGWTIEENKRPVKNSNPVIIELVNPKDYQNGGINVLGNTSGDIYKITWNVKEGAMLRTENYHLEYIVTMDTKEQNFEYNKNYKTNGVTTITYQNENNEKKVEELKVPTGQVKYPTSGEMAFNPGSASHIAYLYIDSNGNVEYSHKIDFNEKDSKVVLPYKEGKILAVFIKQAQTGMIWTSNQVDDETLTQIIKSIKKNDKAYKGHNAVAYGNGNHILTVVNKNKKKSRTVIYSFK